MPSFVYLQVVAEMSYKFGSTGNLTAKKTNLTREISKDWRLYDVDVSILLLISSVLRIYVVLDEIFFSSA